MSIERLYREESGRVLATVIRLVGDFDLAEEAVQEAFAAALEQWPAAGRPANPRAWLVSTARHKAIDHLRRRIRLRAKRAELVELAALEEPGVPPDSPDRSMADDRLRLIFTCCQLYEVLLRLQRSPVVALNHAVAVAMATGPEQGLRRLDALEMRGDLRDYHLLPAAQADLLRRLGRWKEAMDAYRRALALVGNGPERRFLERRVTEVEARAGLASAGGAAER